MRHAGLGGWQKFLDALRESDYDYTYSLDNGSPSALGDAQQALDEYCEIGNLLKVIVGGILIIVHFFDPEHIETTLDPNEITGAALTPNRLGLVEVYGEVGGLGCNTNTRRTTRRSFIASHAKRRG